MARRGRCAPARSTAKSPTAFAANGAPRSTPISDPSSKPHGEDRSEPSTPSASPSRAAPCLAQLENVNGDLSNYKFSELFQIFISFTIGWFLIFSLIQASLFGVC